MKQSLISNYIFLVSYGHLEERLSNKTNIVIYLFMELSSQPIQEAEKIKDKTS